MNQKAFIFDLNGTMIDDMEFHAKAWFSILNDDLNAGLSYEDVKREKQIFLSLFVNNIIYWYLWVCMESFVYQTSSSK